MAKAVLILLWTAAAAASTEMRPLRVVGEISAVENGRLTMRAPGGGEVVLTADAATRCLKTKPGAANLENAETIPIGDVAVGDRVLAAGILFPDGSLSARQVVVMSRSDIAASQERDRDEWRRRGTGGVVKAVDAETQEIAIDVRGAKVPVIVSTAEKKAAFRRYAPDSVKFGDAKPSALAEVQVGDQLRVLGDRSDDGTRITAEQVVSGAFRTIVCTVEAVDAEKGEMRVAVGSRPEKLRVAVKGEVMLRRLRPEQAKEVKRGANLADLLDRMPPLTLAELKAGDHVALSSTRGTDDTRLTAVVLVAGIEPLLAPAAPGRPGGATLMPGLPGGALDVGIGGP
jgi:hypothetical protein